MCARVEVRVLRAGEEEEAVEVCFESSVDEVGLLCVGEEVGS